MSYKQLTHEQRIQIQIYCQEKYTKKEIAKKLNVHPSTIHRELKRNTGKKGYRHKQAHQFATNRKRNAKKFSKLNNDLVAKIIQFLKDDYSPEQISGRLKRLYNIKISHESIYQFIEEDRLDGGMLYKFLRKKYKKSRKKYGKTRKKRGQIKHRISIDKRPSQVNKRKTVGHWEADLIVGRNNKSYIITLVERKMRLTLADKVETKEADVVSKKIISMLRKYNRLVKTITFDNGKEFAKHYEISKALKAKTYFCHPYSSWERGTNENTNGLLRQYFPKKTDLSLYNYDEIQNAVNKLNNRPRKILGYRTPNEVLTTILNSRTY